MKISQNIILLLLILTTILLIKNNNTKRNNKNVSFWMGLERTKERIQEDIMILRQNKDIVNIVSPEAYDLGYNSTLKWNKFSPVSPILQNIGFEVYPMITTVNCEKLYTLLNNPEPFINSAVQECVKKNYTGFNIDFEPSDFDSSYQLKYAKFLDKFANEMHKFNKKLSVDVCSWSKLNNFEAIGKTNVDKVITMDTYASHFDFFSSHLKKMIKYIPLEKISIGLLTTPSLTDKDIEKRVEMVNQFNINQIDVWMLPPPHQFWWFYLKSFTQN